MAPSIGGMWRTFWHTMTSNDRHASHNSPYSTGQHNVHPEGRHAPLTSIATNGTDSRIDLTAQETSEQGNGYPPQSTSGQSPLMPYSPGMRSTMQRTQSSDEGKSLAQSHSGEIQMQNFSEGLPPPPPVSHSWKRIDRWAEENYEELFDNISEGCTQNDINELEHELDCTLPMDVRESLQTHDGQERGGLPTGIIFGCMLLDCEEIVQEWKNWRTVNEEYLTQSTISQSPQLPLKAFGGSSSSTTAAPAAAPPSQPGNPAWREDLLARQDSQPSNAVQKAYAHPAWIPLARDWGGNCLAIDLAPGPAGKWGQVIIMGRDYDCKYVVARSWAALIATVADDISSAKVSVHDETGELKLLEFKEQGVEPAYLDILRWRADQKYGRKGPRRRPNGETRTNPNGVPGKGRGVSPYANSGLTDSDRARSPQRLTGKSLDKRNSRGQISSPLARVAEEVPAGVKIRKGPKNPSPVRSRLVQTENLIATESPRASQDSKTIPISRITAGNDSDKENGRPGGAAMGLGVHLDGVPEAHDDMRTVEI